MPHFNEMLDRKGIKLIINFFAIVQSTFLGFLKDSNPLWDNLSKLLFMKNTQTRINFVRFWCGDRIQTWDSRTGGRGANQITTLTYCMSTKIGMLLQKTVDPIVLCNLYGWHVSTIFQWMTGRFRFLVLKITFAKVCMYCVLKEGNGHFGRLLRLFSQ